MKTPASTTYGEYSAKKIIIQIVFVIVDILLHPTHSVTQFNIRFWFFFFSSICRYWGAHAAQCLLYFQCVLKIKSSCVPCVLSNAVDHLQPSKERQTCTILPQIMHDGEASRPGGKYTDEYKSEEWRGGGVVYRERGHFQNVNTKMKV